MEVYLDGNLISTNVEAVSVPYETIRGYKDLSDCTLNYCHKKGETFKATLRFCDDSTKEYTITYYKYVVPHTLILGNRLNSYRNILKIYLYS